MQLLTLSYDQIAKARTTALLISSKLGDYRRDDDHGSTTTLPSVLAVPVDGDGPTIVAAHPVAPVPGRDGELAVRAGVAGRAVRRHSGGGRHGRQRQIMAGDFNSTLDHYAGLTARSATRRGRPRRLPRRRASPEAAPPSAPGRPPSRPHSALRSTT